MTALGAPAVKQATDALRSINEAIAGWANWTSKHPVKAQIFVDVAAGVSALAIAVGGLGVAAATARVAMWGLGGTPGAVAAAGSTGLPLLASSAGPLGAAGLGAYFGADYLKKGFDKGADWLTGTKADEEKRNRGIGYYFDNLMEQMHKYNNPLPAPTPGSPATGAIPQPAAPASPYAMVPPRKEQPINLNATFNVDGRKLATIVGSELVAVAPIPPQSMVLTAATYGKGQALIRRRNNEGYLFKCERYRGRQTVHVLPGEIRCGCWRSHVDILCTG
jgi:hypothetical protein